MFLDKRTRKEKPRSAHISPLRVNHLLLFWLETLTLEDRYSLMCHILATISTLLVVTVPDRVTHLGSTAVPRTIILNAILAVSKLHGFPCKVRNPVSWRFVYLAVRKGKGLLCEPFAWNLKV